MDMAQWLEVGVDKIRQPSPIRKKPVEKTEPGRIWVSKRFFGWNSRIQVTRDGPVRFSKSEPRVPEPNRNKFTFY
jgi:hypothetical protein